MKFAQARAWVFNGILDVDWDICPYPMVRDFKREGPLTYEELGQYCMVNVDPDFHKKVHRGDYIIAGPSMGYGHDHDHASMSIKGAGVAAVICESSSPYFFRNSIEHGLAVVELERITSIVSPGDLVELDLTEGLFTNRTTGSEVRFRPYPAFILEMLQAGGLYPMLRSQMRARLR